MKYTALSISFLSLSFFGSPAIVSAADLDTSFEQAPVQEKSHGKFFVEGLAGAGFGIFSDPDFINPVGTGFTTNPISGNQIILSDTDTNDAAFSLKVAIGYKFGNNVFVRGSYSYFDELTTSGFSAFAGGNFEQELQVDTHVALGELGYHLPVNDKLFVEASVGLGAAFTNTDGLQGANLGEDNFFPSANDTSIAVNVGGTLGYNFTEKISGLLSVDYTYVGDVDTGVTNGTESLVGVGINPGEQLQSDLNLVRVSAGLRFSF